MKLSSSEKELFFSQIDDLMLFDKVKQMEQYIQHGNTTCLQHCIAVAYYSYAVFKIMHLPFDEDSLIRGALLHDFFLYDWHEKDDSHRWHGFSHPKTALKNAEEYYELTQKENNIIVRHMWPLTLTPPKCREAWMICMVDKVCSLFETVGPYLGNRTYAAALVYEADKAGE